MTLVNKCHYQNDRSTFLPVRWMLTEVRREYDDFVFTRVCLLNTVDVVPTFLVTHKQNVAQAGFPRQVADSAVCVVDHKVRHRFLFDSYRGNGGSWIFLQCIVPFGF